MTDKELQNIGRQYLFSLFINFFLDAKKPAQTRLRAGLTYLTLTRLLLRDRRSLKECEL